MTTSTLKIPAGFKVVEIPATTKKDSGPQSVTGTFISCADGIAKFKNEAGESVEFKSERLCAIIEKLGWKANTKGVFVGFEMAKSPDGKRQSRKWVCARHG